MVEVQPIRSFLFQAKWTWLLADRNQNYASCQACVSSAWNEVLGKSLEWKPRYSRKGSLFSKQSALNYWPIPNEIVLWTVNWDGRLGCLNLESGLQSSGLGESVARFECLVVDECVNASVDSWTDKYMSQFGLGVWWVRMDITWLIENGLTLTLLTRGIWWAPNNASKWQMGFNLAFKGLSRRSWLLGFVARHSKNTKKEISRTFPTLDLPPKRCLHFSTVGTLHINIQRTNLSSQIVLKIR
jgi:hypothetical protein